jgi:serine protease AprX
MYTQWVKSMKSLNKRKMAISIFMLIILSFCSIQTGIFAKTDESIKKAEKVKEFDGGSLYKVNDNGKLKDIIVYDDGTTEDYIESKHSSYLKKDKISKDLEKEIKNVKEDGSLNVAIWFKDIDVSEIEKIAKEKTNIDTFEKAERKEIQKFIEVKRELIKKEYVQQNKIYYSKYIPNEKVLFISEYAPYIIVSLPVKNIVKLAKNDDISSMDMYYDLKKSDETYYSIPNINGNYTRDTKNLKGSGIKVGILETYYADKSNIQLSDRDIRFDISDEQAEDRVSEHATKVTSIVVGKTQGIVPDATVYLATARNRIEDYAKIEWLISQGVNVINYSAGYASSTGLYTDMAKWIDHLAFQLNVTFVKSAGNGGTSYGITDPGMAYNGLTIGSMNDNDSSNEPNWTDDSLSAFSSYIETEGGFKPDFTAPGQGITVAGYINSNGTSYSAPHATGVIAQMFDLKSDLMVYPCALNAILKAGTMHKTATDYGEYGLSPCYSNKEGAGVIDAKGAYNIVSANNYLQLQLYNNVFPYSKTITIDSITKPVRIALHWQKQNTKSGDTIIEKDLSDLDLYVYNPDGTLAMGCYSANSNTELVEFTPTVTGTYTIKVEGYLLENNFEVIGLSWYQ